ILTGLRVATILSPFQGQITSRCSPGAYALVTFLRRSAASRSLLRAFHRRTLATALPQLLSRSVQVRTRAVCRGTDIDIGLDPGCCLILFGDLPGKPRGVRGPYQVHGASAKPSAR